MASAQGMEVYATRLESFGATKAGRKGNSKSLKGQNWPLSNPSADQLARAGFYFDPTPTSPDNVTCYLCLKSLDGWEEDDNPTMEHAKFSPECGIAIHALIEQEVEEGIREHENPASEKLVEARKMTFGEMWPHEKKRGWTCKTQKLVDAGFYYCPTAESDDFVKCAYCGISLDGWEPKDKPLDEHRSQSARCQFFLLAEPPAKTKAKAKKNRLSKSSRASTSSVAATEADTTMDDAVFADDSIISIASDTTVASTASKSTKPKGKKGRPRKNSTAPISAINSSFLEPEDDDFEVKVATPEKPARGRKRKSAEIEEPSEPIEASAPKRRATRTRSSTVKPEEFAQSTTSTIEDVEMSEAEAPVEAPAPKRGRKPKSLASTVARKSTALPTSSSSPLRRPAATDAEIDAALEADLDKRASEDEASPPPKQPAKRGRAASKTQKGKAVAAAARQEAESQAEEASMEPSTIDLSMVTADESIQSITIIKNPKQRAPRGSKRVASKAVEIHVDDPEKEPIDFDETEPTQLEAPQQDEEPKPAKGRGRQPSRKVSRKASKAKPKKAEPEPEPEPQAERTQDSTGEDTIIFQPAVEEQPAPEEAEPEPQPAPEEPEAPPKAKRGRKPGSKNKTHKAKASTTSQAVHDDATKEASEQAAAPPAEETTREAVEDEITEAPPPKRQVSAAKPTRKASARTKKAPPPAPEPESEPEAAAEPEVAAEPEPEPEPQVELEPTPEPSPAPSTPAKAQEASQAFPSPTPSPQASDAENQPPSARPSATRPPLAPVSPIAVSRVPLQPQAVGTPRAQRTDAPAKLRTSFAWTAADLGAVFGQSPGKENAGGVAAHLSSPEKRMTAEEWIRFNSQQAQERLRAECERVVGRFESAGMDALRALEGVVTVD